MSDGIYIALGANLGDRAATLRAALDDLAAEGDVRVVRCSSFHETVPVGGPADQPTFLNAVAEIETDLPPEALLGRLQQIEQRHGRERSVRNAPRTLDLDLLIFRDERIATERLTVPHPRMWQRPFVLEPLAEICDIAELTASGGGAPPGG